PAARLRSTDCRAGPPSPRASSAPGGARHGRPSEVSGPATEASPGPPRRSGRVSSRGPPSTNHSDGSKLFDVLHKTGSVGFSKHLDMPHRPFYLNLRGHGRKCRIPARNEQERAGPHGRSQPRQTTDWPREAAARRRETTVDSRPLSRRHFLRLAHGPAAGVALASCGSSGPSDKTSGGGGGTAAAGAATYWFLTVNPGEKIRQDSVDRFNQANPSTKIRVTKFANDAYKTD